MLSEIEIASMVKRIQRLITDEDTHFHVFDFNTFKSKIEIVKHAFTSNFVHAIAIKSNPLASVLNFASEQGLCFEAASKGEVAIAKQQNTNCIVYDSPIKDIEEIKSLLESPQRFLINTNSLDEFRKVRTLPITNSKSRVGLRINPANVSAVNKELNVGTPYSKFGEPYQNKDAIVKEFLRLRYHGCLHIHDSSQNFDLENKVKNIKKIVDLALEINQKAGEKIIDTIDIGGGLPIDYHDDNTQVVHDYALLLASNIPELFNDTFTVFTEFGRYYSAYAGFAVSNIHEIKSEDNWQTIIQHFGAETFVREIYQPNTWHHRIVFLNFNFDVIEGEKINTYIAGSLCFGGDYIAQNIEAPKLSILNKIVICDTGANSLALWSKHCSLPFPLVIGVYENEEKIIKARESEQSIVDFWN